MIPEETANRLREFIMSLPGVQGFNIMLRYHDRVEMMGSEFPLGEAAEAMTGMVKAVSAGPDAGIEFEVVPPTVH